jgi:hypothetical protein
MICNANEFQGTLVNIIISSVTLLIAEKNLISLILERLQFLEYIFKRYKEDS